MLVHFGFRLVEEVKEACSIVLEAEEIYMNTRCCVLTNNSYLYNYMMISITENLGNGL